MYTGLSRRPYFCTYWVTYRCNSKCQFCNIWKDPALKKIPDASFEQVKKNLDDLKKIGVWLVDFSGGEPLLNSELPQMINYAKQLGFFVKLSTNGFLYENNADLLKDKATRIYFSIDTTSPEEYKIIRGIDGYSQLVKSIQCAKKLKQDICLSCTVTDNTISNLKDIAAFCKEQRIMCYIHPCFSYFGNKQLSKQYVNNIAKFFWHPYIRMSLNDLDFFAKGGNNIASPSCLAGKSALDISPDDCLVIPCFHKCVKKIPLEGKLYSIYSSPQWETMYAEAGRYKHCQNCSIDCYFGLSYWDKIRRGFIKANITEIKNIIESLRFR